MHFALLCISPTLQLRTMCGFFKVTSRCVLEQVVAETRPMVYRHCRKVTVQGLIIDIRHYKLGSEHIRLHFLEIHIVGSIANCHEVFQSCTNTSAIILKHSIFKGDLVAFQTRSLIGERTIRWYNRNNAPSPDNKRSDRS